MVGPFFMALWEFWVSDDPIGNEGSSRLGYEHLMMALLGINNRHC